MVGLRLKVDVEAYCATLEAIQGTSNQTKRRKAGWSGTNHEAGAEDTELRIASVALGIFPSICDSPARGHPVSQDAGYTLLPIFPPLAYARG